MNGMVQKEPSLFLRKDIPLFILSVSYIPLEYLYFNLYNYG